jgi:hypothetical protein
MELPIETMESCEKIRIVLCVSKEKRGIGCSARTYDEEPPREEAGSLWEVGG